MCICTLIAYYVTQNSCYTLSCIIIGSVSCVEGTTEVSPKLLFPVDPLLVYLKEKHDLVGDGKHICVHI